MTRITYVKNEEGTVLTSKEVLAKNKVIIAHIFVPTDKTTEAIYSITDLGSGAAMVKGSAKTVALAKKEVKSEFKKLGVVMNDEVRKKL